MRRLPALLLVALVAATALVHTRVDARRAELPVEQDLMVLPPPQYLGPMSMGYREALADLVWVRAIVFAGNRLGADDGVLIERYVAAVTHLAPRFARPYRWGGITAIYGGTRTIDRDMVDRATNIYRDGLAQFPNDHQLLYALGMLLTYQVSSTKGYSSEERDALAAEGVEFIRRAAANGADPLVRRYAATLVSEHASSALAIQFLESQLVEAKDEDHRRLLRRKLGALTSREAVAQIERVRERFAQEHDRAAPYLPDAVYAVIRPEPGPLPSPGEDVTP
ncbi:MAG: hypothetical protein K0V04_26685 [Deltaproteobacteria bacterium]|nr:hypothetical protein [Deltaproteobacteria bacterium]